MGAPFAAWICSPRDIATVGGFGNVSTGVLSVFLPVADFVLACGRASCSEAFFRVLQRSGASSTARMAFLGCVLCLLHDRRIRSVQACMDDPDPNKGIYTEP